MQRPFAANTPTRSPSTVHQSSSTPTASASATANSRSFLPPGIMNIGNQQQQQSQQPPIPPSAQGSSQSSAAALAMGLGGASGASRMVFPPNSAASTARPSPGIGLGSGTTFGRTASGGAGSFGFGGTAGALGGYGQSTQNLDLNDFPALSSGPNGQPVQASNLASVLGTAASRAAAAGASVAQGFSNDDFPALGGQSSVAQSQAYANGTPAQAALVAATAAAAAEQASAAAALQHQASQREQYRQGLLNNVNGSGSPQASHRGLQSGLNAARGGFGDVDRNYATKLGTSQPSGLPALSTSTGAAPAQGWSPHAADGGEASAGTTSNGVTRSPAPTSTTTPASQILYSPADRFGLAGLLRIIKLQGAGPGAGGANGATPEDDGMLALGSDLQSLGMDVGSDNPLHPTFHTPWSSDAHPLQRSQRSMIEPDFHLLSCYNVQPPPPAQTKVAGFSDETLFFIFYSTPRDVLQEVAAMELHRRNWRFHKELQLWLTKEHSMEPTAKTPMYEKGQYMFWDVETWQRVTKNFVLLYELLEDRSPGQGLLQQQQQQQQRPQQTPILGAGGIAAGGEKAGR